MKPNQLRAPRIAYFPNYLQDIVRYFEPYLNDPKCAHSLKSWWLDFEGVPIKWNWPIGLAYDVLTGHDPKDPDVNTTSSEDPEKRNIETETLVPVSDQTGTNPLDSIHGLWTITLHWKDYPTEYVLALDSSQTWQEYWLNQVKEACYTRQGSAKSIMNLSKDDTTKLIDYVVKHNFQGYWQIMDRILCPKPSIRNIPIKVYFPGSNTVHQALVSPVLKGENDKGSNNLATLGSALHAHFGQLFPSKRTCISARPLIHGIAIPLNAPLVDLLYDMMYSDGYLHLAIVMMP